MEGRQAVTRFDVGIGGRLCLDFVNTVGGRIPDPGRVVGRDHADRVVRERLETYGDLLDWGVESGAVTEAEAEALRRASEQRRAAAAAVRRKAVKLREAIYRLFKSVIEGWPAGAADVDVLNRELAEARRHEYVAVSEGSFVRQWDPDPRSLNGVLWPVTCSAADVLTGADLGRVGQCGGEHCGWLFVDNSRAGRRRWCDMRVCGNRAKVRRHRERQRRQPKNDRGRDGKRNGRDGSGWAPGQPVG